MRTLTPSRRTVVAAALGLVASLSLGGCSQGAGAPPADVGCLLAQFHGELVAENDRPVVRTLGDNWEAFGHAGTVPLDWPDGWTIRPTDGGQLEVLDGNGSVRVRTGTRIVLLHSGDPALPVFNRDGEFQVCAADPYAP
jgi:hypothetical protein